MNRAPFPYPGSKARHADWILEYIPEHRTYVEPFGGAAGVLFAKPESKVEVYNDRDGDIVQFFEVLRDRCDELVDWLEAVPFSRDVHDEWKGAFYEGHRPDDPIERAGRFFALRYMQWGGKYDGPSGFACKPSGNGARSFRRKVDDLQPFADRLRDVYVENLDWRSVVDRYDTPETVFYFDPPYAGTEGNYNDVSIGHRGLHDTLLEIEGGAVVSYDSVPPFYGDEWQVATRDSTFVINSTNGTHKDATEVLLMNFDADGTPIMSDVGQQDLAAFSDT